MACENQKQALDNAKSALDRASVEYWAAVKNLAAAGLTTVGAGVGTAIATGLIPVSGGTSAAGAVVAGTSTIGSAIWTWSAWDFYQLEIDDYNTAEAAYETALDNYCNCIEGITNHN